MPNEYKPKGVQSFDQKTWNEAQGPYQREAVRRCFWRTCLNCDFYHDGKAIAGKLIGAAGCRKFAGVMPPPEIIVHGCDQHEELIPF